MLIRPIIPRPQSVISSQLRLSFSVEQLGKLCVNILSVFNDKLLVSCDVLSQLFIYSREGRHLSTITINDQLYDATWTPRGKIVYTTHSNKVVVRSESGKVITTHNQMTSPRHLSISNEKVIYLADSYRGVYQSTDDGISWNLVFKPTDGWHCREVIKVTTDHSDDFWTLETSDNDENHLCVYSVDRRRFDGNVTWRDINVPTTDGKHIDLLYSSLSYDGNMNIFLSDLHNKAVHVLSVNGQYHCQLLSSHHIKNWPYRLAVDKEHQLLYLGQSFTLVEVFKLTYGEGDNN